MHGKNWMTRYRFMKKGLLSLVVTAFLSAFLAACASSTDPAEAYKNETPQEIYQKGKAALEDKSFGEATKRFEALDVQYPFGTETENAQLYLIYAYYMKEDYALSAAAADRFIRLHPTNPNVDYAYFMRGLANYYQDLGFMERYFPVDLAKRDLTQVQKSYNDFNEVVTLFPHSKYAPEAYQYLIYLRNLMANHELQVAEYYYSRKAYIASANRASELVAHYEGAPAVVDGLVLMAKSYHQLGMTKLEQDTLTVLRYNYPNVMAFSRVPRDA
ncbi:MAG: outer membrane protein assembly factor BamD [Gammaproteobacteria bacterium]|nr:MAG: outer membrane protein assembly factor BamD [Gammaproteobacteria bacterium]